MIRITGGKNRSRLIETPNTVLTKPTMDKVRQAVFSALGEKVYNSRVLDLFAGSGSYGLESLSRGAKEAIFVDNSSLAIETIKKNCEKLNEKKVEIIRDDVLSFLTENSREFDIIFADPPYKLDVYNDIVETLIRRNILSSNGIIILESEKELKLDESKFSSVRFYKYGLAKIYILRK